MHFVTACWSPVSLPHDVLSDRVLIAHVSLIIGTWAILRSVSKVWVRKGLGEKGFSTFDGSYDTRSASGQPVHQEVCPFSELYRTLTRCTTHWQ